MSYKSQHYVPRSYLSGFVDPDAPEEYTPYLWVCERDHQAPFKKAPKNIAEESYYYSFQDESGEYHHEFEELLSRIEGPGIEALRHLSSGTNPTELDDATRAELAFYVGLMDTRVPAFREHMDSQIGDLVKMVSQTAANQPNYFGRTVEKALDASEKDFEDVDVEELRQWVLSGNYDVIPEPLVTLQLILELSPRVAWYVDHFWWRLLEAPDGEAFVTSDNPVVRVSTARIPRWMGVGWETPFMEATFPLTPDLCLLISLHHPPGRELIDTDSLQEVNLRTATYSDSQVYSSREIRCQHDLSPPPGWDGWNPITDATWETVEKEPSDFRSAENPPPSQ